MSVVGRAAGVLARGVVTGVAGTAAMTLSSTVESRVRHRPASTAPARAAQKVLHIDDFSSDQARARFSTAVHWSYGTGWGVPRALLGAAGVPPAVAAPVHFAAMWGGAAVMLPALGVTPPVTRWGSTEVGIDLFHHLVYETAAGLVHQAL
ncbi:MAG TPA: hypothetical protein VI452_06860 [Marmoricola sp.]